MTINEFKAWLEGYEESFTGGSPTPEQWKKIKQKLYPIISNVPQKDPFGYQPWKVSF